MQNNYDRQFEIDTFEEQPIQTSNYSQFEKKAETKAITKILASSSIFLIITLAFTIYLNYMNIGLSNTILSIMSGGFAQALIVGLLISFVISAISYQIEKRVTSWGFYILGSVVINLLLMYYLMLFKLIFAVMGMTFAEANYLLVLVVGGTVMANLIVGFFAYSQTNVSYRATGKIWWILFLTSITWMITAALASMFLGSTISFGSGFNILSILVSLVFIGFEVYLLFSEYNNVKFYEENKYNFSWQGSAFRINILLVNIIVDVLNIIVRIMGSSSRK